MKRILARAVPAVLAFGLLSAAAIPAASQASPAGRASPASQAVSGPRAGGRQPAAVIAISRQVKRQYDLHAVVVGVWIDGRPLAVSALGQSLSGQPATTAMHFRVGSVAIPFLTTLLLQLAQEGRVSLNDPLSRWLPAIPNASRVTLGDLAGSRSGYSDYVTNPALTKRLYANPFQYFSTAYQLSLGVTKPLHYPPGTSFNYAHTNFVLLGLALEKITGRPLASLIRNRIFRPLGLRNTFLSDRPYITPPVLEGYDSERGVYEDATYWNPSWTLAHGAIMTSDISDLGRTAIAVGTGRLLSRPSYRQMIAPRSLLTLPGQPKAYYGLGIFLDNSWVIQNPLLPGYSGTIAYLPSARVAIAVETTPGKRSAINTNFSTDVAKALSRYLVPNQPIRTSAGPG